MCLIIYKAAGVPLIKELVEQSVKDNPDGWGIMHKDKWGLRVTRGLRAEDYVKEANKIGLETPAVLHTRIGTSGNKDVLNCHPFRLSHDIAMMHNGVIDIARPDQSKSDTFHFAKNVVGPMIRRRAGLFNDEKLKLLLSEAIGGSKLVFMNAAGEVMIVNENKGEWHKGLWISNTRSLYGPAWGTHNNYNYYDNWEGYTPYNTGDGYWMNGVWRPIHRPKNQRYFPHVYTGSGWNENVVPMSSTTGVQEDGELVSIPESDTNGLLC